MPRHAAPRSPRRRPLVGGLLALLGLAATVATGVLAAPHHRPTTTAPPVWTTAPETPPSLAAPPSGPSDLEVEESLASIAASESSQRVQEASESAARSSEPAASSQAVQDAKERAQRATPSQAPEPTRTTAAPKPAPAPAPTSSKPPPTTAAPRPSLGTLKDYALDLLGGDLGEFACLDKLWTRESGWNPAAQNPSSSASGIAQLLDGTYAALGLTPSSDGKAQIRAGLAYIRATYGSACAAWNHSQAVGWY